MSDFSPKLPRIAHVNTAIAGGAAIAARRLHTALVDLGAPSHFYHLNGSSPDATYTRFTPPQPSKPITKAIHKLKQYLQSRHSAYFLQQRPPGYDAFSYTRTLDPFTLAHLSERPDIIHLHWISSFIDYPTFFNVLPDNIPLVWTIHDMNPFTGGCHYTWDCNKFKTTCHTCPQLDHASISDLSAQNFKIKLEAFKDKNMHIVANSHWTEKQVRESILFSQACSIQTIHNGLDIKTFSPKDKQQCRALLNIPPHLPVIAFGADGIDMRRKGLAELCNALSLLSMPLVLLVFGSGNISVKQPNLMIKSLGSMNAPELLALAYSAADIFVIPSLHEAFGQTALEAMACGIPVVGFATGGIPDMIHHKQTGLLAQPGQAQDLAVQIQWLLEHPEERVSMGAQARALVEQEFTLEHQAQQYLALYKKLWT